MAGDWIKMRTDLGTSPKVVRLASALKADGCPDRFRVVGALHAAWCLFDAHTDDGRLTGYTLAILDDLLGWPGFAAAMVEVGWLEVDGESLVLPRFQDHNGKSAKRRAMDADRKRAQRSVPKTSAFEADKSVTREEKRREENKEQELYPPISPPAPEKRKAPTKKTRPPVGAEVYSAGFVDFWEAYPSGKRSKKAEAWEVWQRDQMEDFAETIVKDVVKRKAAHWGWVKESGKYIPGAQVYLNGRRWNDDIEPIPARLLRGRRDAVEQANAERARAWATGGAAQ